VAARHKETERDKVRAATRQALLDAAAVEFASEGYVGANINRISQSAGFAKGTIYNYFPSKRALMLALLEEIATLHVEYMISRVEQEADVNARVVSFFAAGAGFVSNYLSQARIMLSTLNGPDEDFKMHMWQAYQPLFEFVGTEIVGAGIQQGIFRQVDPIAMANLLMTIYLGTASQVNEAGKQWLDPHYVADFALNALRKDT
jgi:AcrR family transcriptional regulator